MGILPLPIHFNDNGIYGKLDIMKHAMTVFAEQAVACFGEAKKVKEVGHTEQAVLDLKETRMD